ncbi:MAG: AMP-binding protein [Pseudomonadota bacterium]
MQARRLTNQADIEAIESAGFDAFQPWHSVPQALEAAAARHATRPAISWLPSADLAEPAQRWTYAELMGRVRQSANLLHGLGVDDDHSVALLLPAMPQAWLALLGGETAGRVCPINVLLEVPHIAALLDAAQARVLIALAPCSGFDIAAKAVQLQRLCPDLQHVLWVGGDVQGGASFESLLETQPADRLVFERRIDRDTVAACFHTGGTTGAPKLALHSHGNQLHTATSAALFYAADEHDVIVNGFPLFHVAGAFVYGLSMLLSGAHLVLPTLLGLRNPAFVQRYWQFVERERVTLLAAVPTVISALLNVDPGGSDITSVRLLLTGGSPLPDELAASFERRFKVPVRNILGMTECAGVISIEPFHAPRVPGSCGLRLPFTQVGAVADGARPIRLLPAGYDGILALRGPNVSPGYSDAARNARTFVDGGWLVTGDIGHVANDGRVFVTGRAKDLIIRSGHNIDPGVIEEALLAHPEVLHAAAVGAPDEYAGEVPVAFVVLRPGSTLSAEALLTDATPRMPERPAWPKRLTLLNAMPMTAIGKVYKPALRCQAVAHALRERLDSVGLQQQVSLSVDETARGLVVRFDAADADAAAIEALMAPFPLRYSIERTP